MTRLARQGFNLLTPDLVTDELARSKALNELGLAAAEFDELADLVSRVMDEADVLRAA